MTTILGSGSSGSIANVEQEVKKSKFIMAIENFISSLLYTYEHFVIKFRNFNQLQHVLSTIKTNDSKEHLNYKDYSLKEKLDCFTTHMHSVYVLA